MLAVELMIQDAVESLEAGAVESAVPSKRSETPDSQVVDQPRMTLIGQQEVWCRESLEELKEAGRSLNTDALEVWRNIGDGDRERLEKWVQVRCCCDRVH